MPRSLKLYITGLVAASAVALVVTSFVFPVGPGLAIEVDGLPGASPIDLATGLTFWISVTLFASALPVKMPRGTLVGVGIAPVLAAMNLGGPTAAAWIAFIGTTELRELRGHIPWYGTLANHAGIALPAIIAGSVVEALGTRHGPAVDFLVTMLAATIFFALNLGIVSAMVSLRTNQQIREVFAGDARGYGINLLALGPLAWLMARVYAVPAAGWWATLLFALPLYTTRVAHHRFVEMREMFTQTIGALAEAVDKRDPFTSRHSHNVKAIAA